jgi:hypothetical protein
MTHCPVLGPTEMSPTTLLRIVPCPWEPGHGTYDPCTELRVACECHTGRTEVALVGYNHHDQRVVGRSRRATAVGPEANIH